MSKTITASLVAATLSAASLMLAAQPAAAATSAVTWASGTGSDSNDCLTPTTACRQILGAFGKTSVNGVINVLPGLYGSFAIAKAVQIIADQGNAVISGSCTGSAGTCGGLLVLAGAGDVVRIRGITVNQSSTQSPSFSGITLLSGAALQVENCTLVQAGSTGPGLQIVPSTAASGGMPVSITVRNSAIDSNVGGNVLVAPTNSVAVNVVLDHVSTSGGLFGVKADNTASGKIRVDARDSVANDNANNGYIATGDGVSPVHFMIERSTASGNGAYGAVATGAQAFMIATYATLIGNATGLAQLAGSTVAATGTNTINFNAANTAGTITAITLH